MKMKSYMPIALALMLSFPCHAQESAPKGIEAYADKDLRKSADKKKQELYKQFQALTGDKPDKNASPQFEAWWIRQFRASNAAWMFLEAYPGYEVPDASGVQIHVFDKNWKRLVKQSFQTGYRLFLNEAQVLKHDAL